MAWRTRASEIDRSRPRSPAPSSAGSSRHSAGRSSSSARTARCEQKKRATRRASTSVATSWRYGRSSKEAQQCATRRCLAASSLPVLLVSGARGDDAGDRRRPFQALPGGSNSPSNAQPQPSSLQLPSAPWRVGDMGLAKPPGRRNASILSADLARPAGGGPGTGCEARAAGLSSRGGCSAMASSRWLVWFLRLHGVS